MSVQTQLNTFGVAQVLIFLNKSASETAMSATVANPFEHITKHCVRSAASRQGALAIAESVNPPPPFHIYKNLGIVLGSVDNKGYKEVKESEGVRAVTEVPEVSLIRPVAAASAAPQAGPTWGIKRLNVPAVWSQGFTGKGVVVAHLDTGVDGKHPVVKDAILAFAQFDNLGRQVPNAKPTDSDEHGTHTAATIAGRKHGSTAVGVAPDAMLASAMVIEGGNVIARILGGMDWAIGQGAKVLSMSLGLRGFRNEFLQLMSILRGKGILPVIAVGNEGAGTSRSPGNYEICMSVGACDKDDTIPDFSSSQRFNRTKDPIVPDLVAPGVGVLSAVPGAKFGVMDGSSMATPHIAGLAALLWEAKPLATVDEIEMAIESSCARPAGMPENRANRGVPDAALALTILMNVPS